MRLILSVLVALVVGCFPQGKQQEQEPKVEAAKQVEPKPEEPPIPIDLYLVGEPIHHVFNTNPLYAEKQYAGKRFEFVLSGFAIGRDSLSQEGLECNLTKDSVKAISERPRVETVKAVGRMRGKINGVYVFDDVQILHFMTDEENRAWSKDQWRKHTDKYPSTPSNKRK